jgi:hypothetical protein
VCDGGEHLRLSYNDESDGGTVIACAGRELRNIVKVKD